MQRSKVLITVVGICALIALMAVVLWPQPGPAAASHVAAIPVGGLHSCALTNAGGVQCWGRNDVSQLGDGTLVNSTTPIDVVGLETGVAAIAAGDAHTCALTTAGGVKCWGRNSFGQLGDGTTVDRATPVDVSGLTSGVSAVAAGASHTCAVTTAGGANCWGTNSSGQLGDGTPLFRTTPVDVIGFLGVVPLVPSLSQWGLIALAMALAAAAYVSTRRRPRWKTS